MKTNANARLFGIRSVLFCCCATQAVCLADTQPLALTLRSASPALPAGGTAQIQIFAPQPAAITAGSFTLTFDAAFGRISTADVFSATGDQSGYAKISGNQIEFHFRSITGGIGRLPSSPIAAVNVMVAASSGTGAVTLTSASFWSDVPGYQYSVPSSTQTFPVGNAPYIDSANFASSPIKLLGGGFQAGAALQIEGIGVGQVSATPTEIDVTLATSLEPTGKRITVTNPDGGVLNFFGGIHGPIYAPVSQAPLTGVQPIFPSRQFQQGSCTTTNVTNQGILALQNITSHPVPAAFTSALVVGPPTRTEVTIAPGSTYFAQAPLPAYSTISVFTSSSLRMLNLFQYDSQISWGDAGTQSPSSFFQASFNGDLPTRVNFAPGGPAPAPVSLHVRTYGFTAPFTVAVNPEAATWMKVSPTTGITCDATLVTSPAKCSDNSLVVVTIDPSALTSGTYHANVTLSVSYPNATGSMTGVDLNIVPAVLSYTQQGTGQYLVTSIPRSVPVVVSISTKDGSNWLSATSSSPTTPTVITVTQNRDPGLPDSSGTVLITGAGQSLNIPVSFTSQLTQFGVPPNLSYGTRTSEGRRFLGIFQGVGGNNIGTLTASISTDDGAPWLEASVSSRQLVFYADALDNHLAPGTYFATVKLQLSTGVAANVRVSLVVYDGTDVPGSDVPWIRISQSVPLEFTSTTATLSAPLSLTIDDGNIPFFARVQTPPWLRLQDNGNLYSFGIPAIPGTLTFIAAPSSGLANTPLTPGTYSGNIQIDLAEAYFNSVQEGQTHSLSLPVIYTVTPATTTPAPSEGPAFLNTVVSAASATAAAIAPGEIVTLYGLNIGPNPAANLTLDATGKVATDLSDTQILFNGAPAPLLYAGSSQVNGIVPYEAEISGAATIEIVQTGTRRTLATVPLAASAPGIFTLNATGTGPAAALNQDLSVNSTSNPAPRGSIAVLYATGEGLTNPASVTGSINPSTVSGKPLLPLHVFIGGREAIVTYAGAVPFSVAGFLQINAIIPADVPPGPAVPLLLRVGEVDSPLSATIAVQ